MADDRKRLAGRMEKVEGRIQGRGAPVILVLPRWATGPGPRVVTWLLEGRKPTEAEIASAIRTVEAEELHTEVEHLKKMAAARGITLPETPSSPMAGDTTKE